MLTQPSPGGTDSTHCEAWSKNKNNMVTSSSWSSTRTETTENCTDDESDSSVSMSSVQQPRRKCCEENTTSESSACEYPADIQRWELRTILGEGNFGQVWQVANETSNKKSTPQSFALKMLSKHQLACDGEVHHVFEEKRILKLCNEHPFIIKLRNAWQDEDLVYFLQDFVQGGELYSRMIDQESALNYEQFPVRKAMDESHVQFYTACIADALHYMHSKSVCYRDLKPENVLLDDRGYPVLIDLGLATVLDSEEERSYTLCGTPRYIAPETLGEAGHSYGVDHWALGVLAYEMLTGDNPFDRWDDCDNTSLFEAIVYSDYPALPSTVSSEARNWVAELLVKAPEDRLGHAAANDEKLPSPLLTHPWLAHFNVPSLRKRATEAPWRPALSNEHDSCCFDDWDHLEPIVQPVYPRLCRRQKALFDGFDEI